MDVSSWQQLFEELVTLRLHRLTISGGEPLTYPGAADLLASLATMRVSVDLLTNGTLIDARVAAVLSSANFRTTVSLDGPPEANDAVRGRGSFARIARGLGLLREAGARFHIATTITDRNAGSLRAAAEVAQGFGAESVNYIFVDPVGRAAHRNWLWLTQEQIQAASDEIAGLKRAFAGEMAVESLDPASADYGLPETEEQDKRDVQEEIWCPAGTVRVAVRWDGLVFPCVYAFADETFTVGSVQNVPMAMLWRSNKWGLFRGDVKLEDLTRCSTCPLAPTCRAKICRLRAHYVGGDFFGQPPSCPYLRVPEAGASVGS